MQSQEDDDAKDQWQKLRRASALTDVAGLQGQLAKMQKQLETSQELLKAATSQAEEANTLKARLTKLEDQHQEKEEASNAAVKAAQTEAAKTTNAAAEEVKQLKGQLDKAKADIKTQQ